ncbi:PD-(D/E)XK nuclease family protein [Blattabacterium cuenoti]|uniref:PD-(D/E)XK nuclease family protein n=1 Tax=Blattabacterium cuenoti TaxID=1653831 RepID=UPI00163CC918|nr:PD-(D/E)XK nuclease family protein [Blattabacterium cuenoti]
MKKRIDRIIQYFFFDKKIKLGEKFILTSVGDSIIEYIKSKYQFTVNPLCVSFLTIEKLLENVSGLRIIDNNFLLLYLFYSLKNKSEIENNFSYYLKWGPKILNDFKNIDYEIIDIENFFSLVISAEKIKKWTTNISFLKEKKFIFWEKVYEYYKTLQSELLKKGFAYKEMIFRLLVNKYLDSFFYKNVNTTIILFFNSNFLYEKYVRYFLNKIDKYEKGFIYDLSEHNFRKKYFLILKKERIKLDNLEIISVSKEIEQVKIVENIIYSLYDDNNKKYKCRKKILVAIGDKYLFVPLLHSIKRIKGCYYNFNIEYPLRMVSIHYTIDSIFQLLLKKNKHKEFNKKDIIRLLSDRYIKKFFLQEDSLLRILLETKSIFISEHDLNKYLLNNDLRFILEIQNSDTKKILLSLLNFIRKIKKFFKEDTSLYSIEHEFISKLENYIQKIKIIVRKKTNLFFGIKDIFSYYEQFLNTESIRYIKKNEDSNKNEVYITVTGFIDDHFIFDDFDTTIITSFNEGIIPSYYNKNTYSFIPFDIRKKLEIDYNNENFYFHHLMKILHFSNKIFIIYKNNPDELNSGEKSRFIHQIERISNISIKQINFPFIPKNLNTTPIVIKKTRSIIKSLDKLAYQGFSPSSIHLYNYNPILFYYKKILGLKDLEKTNIKQEIGKIIHQVLETLYCPLKGSLMTLDLIQNEIKKKLEYVIKKFILETTALTIEGEKMLYYPIIKNYVDNFIHWDEESIRNGHKIFIREIEHKISTTLDLNKRIKLHGIIDRIDEYDGIIRIIDYKIGFSKKKEINISSNEIENIFKNPYLSNVMQLLIYLYLWFKYYEKEDSPRIGIVSPYINKYNSVIHVSINFFYNKKINITYKDYKNNILPFLINRILEIMDPEKPIIETIIQSHY